jgi:hypothetical protein
MTKELDFLAGKHFTYELPKERQFLWHFFKTPIEQQFLRYYFCFDGDLQHFQDHTGIYCQERWLKILTKRLLCLIDIRDTAKKSFELEKLARIEMGEITLEELECK